jgi:hypothetical protein
VGRSGAGRRLLKAWTIFLVTDVVVIGIIAYAFALFMRTVERWLVPWKGKVRKYSILADPVDAIARAGERAGCERPALSQRPPTGQEIQRVSFNLSQLPTSDRTKPPYIRTSFTNSRYSLVGPCNQIATPVLHQIG